MSYNIDINLQHQSLFLNNNLPLNISNIKKRITPFQRKQQILHALQQLLHEPAVEKINITNIAKKAEISEAIIYKHFNNKTALFLALIEIIEEHIFTHINQIETNYDNAIEIINQIVSMLLDFSEQNPPLTRILTNEALFYEDKSLHLRMQQLIDRIEASLRQAYKIAGAQNLITKGKESIRANYLLCYIMGCWQIFSRSGFKKLPKEMWKLQKNLMLEIN